MAQQTRGCVCTDGCGLTVEDLNYIQGRCNNNSAGIWGIYYLYSKGFAIHFRGFHKKRYSSVPEYYDEAEKIIKGIHEAIVSEHAWWKVQGLLGKKYLQGDINSANTYKVADALLPGRKRTWQPLVRQREQYNGIPSRLGDLKFIYTKATTEQKQGMIAWVFDKHWYCEGGIYRKPLLFSRFLPRKQRP